jgi:UPF0716 family protein affecting phage T7 exclusion
MPGNKSKALPRRLLAAMLIVIAPTVVAASYAETLGTTWTTIYLLASGVVGLVLLRRLNRD